MSQKLFRFLIGELKSLRVICKHPGCGGIIEMPLSSVIGKNSPITCPLCDKPLQHQMPNNHLAQLARSIEAIAMAGIADVEFLLPLDNDAAMP
jgi:hypothetical protein